MSDLSLVIAPEHAERLQPHVDAEAKIARTLDELGPVVDRDVVLVGGGPMRREQLQGSGARVVATPGSAADLGVADAGADVVVGAFSVYRGVAGLEAREADRALRPGGRLLVIHDYGRDDVSRLRSPDEPEYRSWSRRDGPFLGAGFRLRVVHCWWTFASLDEAASVLQAAFGGRGADLAAGLARPRLSYNVAVYHRGRGQG